MDFIEIDKNFLDKEFQLIPNQKYGKNIIDIKNEGTIKI